jgi:hypothetical protein
LLCRKVLAAIFKAILMGLLVGSRPLPITLFPLGRLVYRMLRYGMKKQRPSHELGSSSG